MTNIEQYIKYHTNIDFKRFNYLTESMKHIDDIDIYAEAIVKKLLNFIISSKTKQIDLSQLIIPNELINGYSMHQMVWYVIITEILWMTLGGRKLCKSRS